MDCGISIIVPLFNKETFALQTLRLLLNELTNIDELIVVDDHSTDSSYEIVEKLFLLHTANCHVFRLEKNSGPSTARNFGVKHSTRPYVLFFDADDMPLPGLISALRESINQFPLHKIFTFIISRQSRNECFINQNLPIYKLLTIRPLHAYAHDYLKGKLLLHPSCTLISREILLSNLFIEDLRYCEDPELWVRLSSQYEIVQINKTYAVYRDISGSLSYTQRDKIGAINEYLNTLISLHQKYGFFYKKIGILILVKNLIFARANGASIRSILKQLNLYKDFIGLPLFI